MSNIVECLFPSIQFKNLIEFQSNSENVLLPIHSQSYTCTFLISNISIHQSIFTSTSSCLHINNHLIKSVHSLNHWKQVSLLDLCIHLQFASIDSYIKGCAKGNFKIWVAPWKHLQPPSAWWDPLSKARKALAASRLGLSSPTNQQKRSQSDHTAWRLSPHKHENEKNKCSHKCKQKCNHSIYLNKSDLYKYNLKYVDSSTYNYVSCSSWLFTCDPKTNATTKLQWYPFDFNHSLSVFSRAPELACLHGNISQDSLIWLWHMFPARENSPDLLRTKEQHSALWPSSLNLTALVLGSRAEVRSSMVVQHLTWAWSNPKTMDSEKNPWITDMVILLFDSIWCLGLRSHIIEGPQCFVQMSDLKSQLLFDNPWMLVDGRKNEAKQSTTNPLICDSELECLQWWSAMKVRG